MKWYLLLVLATLASVVLTGLIRRRTLRLGLLDRPNERSSHSVPTPRGGGLSVVIVTTLGSVFLWYRGVTDWALLLALLIGGSMVATVGYVDDQRSLPPLLRIGVHLISAACAVYLLGGPSTVQSALPIGLATPAAAVACMLAVVWVLNVFNFMDGIDGIAASEAVFVAAAGGLLCLQGCAETTPVALIFAAACAGFLGWNWPPAKIFLGDVGSGYLGYVIVVLALGAARDNPAAPWIWLILSGAFFVDATVTVLRRLVRGERVYQAHRSHAYQWLARRWNSHGRVTVTIVAVNLGWLLPWALLATRRPNYAIVCVIAALAPLTLLAAVLGSGRREDHP